MILWSINIFPVTNMSIFFTNAFQDVQDGHLQREGFQLMIHEATMDTRLQISRLLDDEVALEYLPGKQLRAKLETLRAPLSDEQRAPHSSTDAMLQAVMQLHLFHHHRRIANARGRDLRAKPTPLTPPAVVTTLTGVLAHQSFVKKISTAIDNVVFGYDAIVHWRSTGTLGLAAFDIRDRCHRYVYG